MGGISFTVAQDGLDMAAAFEAARQTAAHHRGWAEDSGTIATKQHPVLVHDGPPLPAAAAHELAQRLLAEFDGVLGDHYSPQAGAIPVAAVDGGPITGWLFVGWAND